MCEKEVSFSKAESETIGEGRPCTALKIQVSFYLKGLQNF